MTAAKLRPGVTVAQATRLLRGLAGITEGSSYGMPSFKLHGKFFARFRDQDTVLVLQLTSIAERDVLLQMAPKAFFFTDHYRDYPAVLVRLAEIPGALLADVVTDAWRECGARRAARPRRKT